MVAQSPLTKWRNHSLPMRARYEVSFVKSKSHIGILFIKWYFFCSCYSELRFKIVLTFQQSVWKIFWTNSLKPGLQKYLSSMNGISRSEGLSQAPIFTCLNRNLQDLLWDQWFLMQTAVSSFKACCWQCCCGTPFKQDNFQVSKGFRKICMR